MDSFGKKILSPFYNFIQASALDSFHNPKQLPIIYPNFLQKNPVGFRKPQLP